MIKKKYVWVELEVIKFFNKVTIFRGKILEKDLKKWAKGKIKNNIKIENFYWFEYKKEVSKIYYTIPGRIECDPIFNKFTGTYYLLAKNIIGIATLKNGSEYFAEIERINSACNNIVIIKNKKIIL